MSSRPSSSDIHNTKLSTVLVDTEGKINDDLVTELLPHHATALRPSENAKEETTASAGGDGSGGGGDDYLGLEIEIHGESPGHDIFGGDDNDPRSLARKLFRDNGFVLPTEKIDQLKLFGQLVHGLQKPDDEKFNRKLVETYKALVKSHGYGSLLLNTSE